MSYTGSSNALPLTTPNNFLLISPPQSFAFHPVYCDSVPRSPLLEPQLPNTLPVLSVWFSAVVFVFPLPTTVPEVPVSPPLEFLYPLLTSPTVLSLQCCQPTPLVPCLWVQSPATPLRFRPQIPQAILISILNLGHCMNKVSQVKFGGMGLREQMGYSCSDWGEAMGLGILRTSVPCTQLHQSSVQTTSLLSFPRQVESFAWKQLLG